MFFEFNFFITLTKIFEKNSGIIKNCFIFFAMQLGRKVSENSHEKHSQKKHAIMSFPEFSTHTLRLVSKLINKQKIEQTAVYQQKLGNA